MTDAPRAAFLPLNFDPLTNLQDLRFYLPDSDEIVRFEFTPQYSLIPSIVEWLKMRTPRLTCVTIWAIYEVSAPEYSGPSLVTPDTVSQHWISVDHAFRKSSSGLEALQKVQLDIQCQPSYNQVIEDGVQLATPFLSVVEVNRVPETMYDW